MKPNKLLLLAASAMLLFAGMMSCSDDKKDDPIPPGPGEPTQPTTPAEKVFSPLEPLMVFGQDVPYIKAHETRNLRRDTTKVLYEYQAIRTLIYDGKDEDIAFYYYYHFLKAELYMTEMLCPKVPEVTEILDSIFKAEYKYWRWSDVNTCDMYLTPDSTISVRKEIWTDESLGMDLYRIVYQPTSPEEIKKYYN